MHPQHHQQQEDKASNGKKKVIKFVNYVPMNSLSLEEQRANTKHESFAQKQASSSRFVRTMEKMDVDSKPNAVNLENTIVSLHQQISDQLYKHASPDSTNNSKTTRHSPNLHQSNSLPSSPLLNTIQQHSFVPMLEKQHYALFSPSSHKNTSFSSANSMHLSPNMSNNSNFVQYLNQNFPSPSSNASSISTSASLQQTDVAQLPLSQNYQQDKRLGLRYILNPEAD